MTARLTKQTAPLILGLGRKAKQGKSECAAAIYQKFSKDYGGLYDIMRVSFAGPLRKEVEAAIEDIKGEELSVQDKVKELCLMAGTDYDPNAPTSPEYPYSKQRALLQWWGTQFRRAQDVFYWVNLMEQSIIERKPQIVLIDDLRFPNEFFWLHSLAGVAIRVQRPDYKSDVPQHISETALDGYEFDHTITSQEDQLDELRSDAIALFETIVNRWSGAECASFFESVIPELVGQKETYA